MIVDDRSDDDVYNELRKLESEKIHIFQRGNEKKGPSACRNIGAKKARGEYLIFLDSDDRLKNFCIRQRKEVMDKMHDMGICVFLMEEFYSIPGDVGTTFNIPAPSEKLPSLFLQNNNPWQTMAPIWRRDFYFEIGGFDEDLFFMEDPDLHLRTLYRAPEKVGICYHYPADCLYRIHHMDGAKKDFWYNSIYYRILFFKKLTSGFYSDAFLKYHSNDIRSGIYNLLRTFLFSRYNVFPQLYADLEHWMKSSELFSRLELWRIRTLVRLGNRNVPALKILRLKGICFYLLPKAR